MRVGDLTLLPTGVLLLRIQLLLSPSSAASIPSLGRSTEKQRKPHGEWFYNYNHHDHNHNCHPSPCAGSVYHWTVTTATTTAATAAASPTAAPASRRTACAPRPSHRMTAHQPQPPIIIQFSSPPTTTTTTTITTASINLYCCCCRCLFPSISSLSNSFGMRWLSNMTTLSTLTTRSLWLPCSLMSSRAIRSTWML